MTGGQDEHVLHGIDWGGEGHKKWALEHRELDQQVHIRIVIASTFLSKCNKGSRQKKQIFYDQADRKGGGVNPPWPDRTICENFRT